MRSSDSEKSKRESEIIDMFFRRDPAALKSVSDDYGRLFRRIAFNITSSDTAADEVANDVLLALWNAIPPARPENLSAYGSAVARNIALGRVRSELSGGRPAIEEELEINGEFRSKKVFRVMIRYICPICLAAILISGLYGTFFV